MFCKDYFLIVLLALLLLTQVIYANDIDDDDEDNSDDDNCNNNNGCSCGCCCCSNNKKSNVNKKRDTCGISKPKRYTEYSEDDESPVEYIIGGRKALPGEHPWQVYIKVQYPNAKGHRICGGTIWNSKYVLTAAHCVSQCKNGEIENANKVEVCVGDLDVKKKDGEKCFDITKYTAHPDYNQCTNRILHDIALIKLPHKVKVPNLTRKGFGSTNAACHPKEEEYEGFGVTLGWGIVDWDKKTESSAHLKSLNLPIWSNEDCEKYWDPRNKTIEQSHICAGGDLGQNVCMGDSGGPLLWYDTSSKTMKAHVIGVLSFSGFPCAAEGMPAIFVRVSEYLDWIDETIESM